jgi:hypothetical protein
MTKIASMIGGLALMGTTLVAAAPQTATPQSTPKAPAPVTSSQPLPWESQQSQACNLLCIQGDHCCIIHNKATCVPDTQACP